ncbi:MAG: hypothetical protein IK143_07710 [Bacteroidales bacterium]|nr:hypothetical protein [Bacteroidales bacterium]
MKKTITAALAVMVLCQIAQAQTLDDILNASKVNYGGTARSMAMGNAMTAVGGDLGSLTINPAGSAVATYDQFTVTPAFSVSSTNSIGTPYQGQDHYGFEDNAHGKRAALKLPNFGYIHRTVTSSRHGIRSWSVGIAVNSTGDFLHKAYGSGTSTGQSLAAQLATMANGISYSDLNGDYAYDRFNWRPVVAYKSEIISTYGDSDNQYCGVTQKPMTDGTLQQAGTIEQQYSRITGGSRSDFVVNFAANVDNWFYFGANLGLVAYSTSRDEYIREYALNPDEFGIDYGSGTIYYDRSQFLHRQDISGTGIYLKAGVIARPVAGLRLGAAIQTPTWTDVTSRYVLFGDTYYTNGEHAWAESPEETLRYTVRTPFRANAGLAYTIGQVAILSADYEYADYSQARYHDEYTDDFEYVMNEDIKASLGETHTFRAGVEIKPSPMFSVRAGYNQDTDKFKVISFGLGYSSAGSFFADFSIRKTLLPDEFLELYAPYDNNGITISGPELQIRSTLWNTAFTLGWRF